MFLDPRRVRYAEFFDWFEGRMGTLFQVPPTAINGLGFIKPHHLANQFNFFSVLSRFYASAVMSDLPVVNGETFRLLNRATEHWSVCGETLLLRQQGRVRAVRPDFVWPITSEYDTETVERILLIYPRRDTEAGDWYNQPVSSIRALVIEYDVETRQAWRSIREFTPGNIGDGPRGEPIDVERMVWVKSGEPPYVALEGAVRELTVRLNMLQLGLNSTSVPLVQLDSNTLADGKLRNTEASLDAISEIAAKSPLGLTTTPPFAGEEGARYVERSGSGLAESLDYLRLMLGQLGVLSGVPDYVFGVQLGRPSDETARVLFAGQARVNAFQLELREALSQVGVDVAFNYDPFLTRQQRIENAVNQLEAGILTVNEARGALGLGQVPADDGNGSPNRSGFPAGGLGDGPSNGNNATPVRTGIPR